MPKTRKQLTLFVTYNKQIEEIRELFNPIQHSLIAAHITLCREDEIEEIDKVIANINTIILKGRILIELGKPVRFDAGKGVLIPAKSNNQLDLLRKIVLSGIISSPGQLLAHITLIHPRNSVCKDTIFNQIKAHRLPTSLSFDSISLIEQVNNEPWNILAQYRIAK